MARRWERLNRKLDKRIAEREEEKRRQEHLDLVDRRWNEGGEALRRVELAAEEALGALEDFEQGRISEEALEEIAERDNLLYAQWLAGELPEQQQPQGVTHDDG